MLHICQLCHRGTSVISSVTAPSWCHVQVPDSDHVQVPNSDHVQVLSSGHMQVLSYVHVLELGCCVSIFFFLIIFFYLCFLQLYCLNGFSHVKFGLPSPGKASCDTVALPTLQCMLGALVFP